MDEVRDRAEAVDTVARIGVRITAVRAEFSSSLSLLEECAIQRHRNVRNSFEEAVVQSGERMACVSHEEAMCMQVRVGQAIYKAVYYATTHNQGMREEVFSKLSQAV